MSCARLANATAPASRSGKLGWLVTRASMSVRLAELRRFSGQFTRAESRAGTRQVGDDSRFKPPLMNMLFISSIPCTVCVRESVTSWASLLPLGGVAQVGLHGVKVVEVGVVLRVHQDRGVEEDGEGQVEVEREEGEVKENRTCMTME